MNAIFAVLFIASLGLSAYLQARRSGVWSWKRFGITVVVLGAAGAGFGLLAAEAGRRSGPDHAAAIALAAGGAILLFVFVFAYLTRGWRPPRR